LPSNRYFVGVFLVESSGRIGFAGLVEWLDVVRRRRNSLTAGPFVPLSSLSFFVLAGWSLVVVVFLLSFFAPNERTDGRTDGR